MNDIRMMLATALLAFAAVGCDAGDGETIGPRGGVVVSDDGLFSLEIPEGALETEVEITIEQVECDRADALANCYEVGPVGLPLLFPAEVVYEVDEQMLQTFEGHELAVMSEKADDWNYLADRDVDTEEVTVSASAVYLSSFALVAMP